MQCRGPKRMPVGLLNWCVSSLKKSHLQEFPLMTYLSSFSIYKEGLIVSKAFEIQEKNWSCFWEVGQAWYFTLQYVFKLISSYRQGLKCILTQRQYLLTLNWIFVEVTLSIIECNGGRLFISSWAWNCADWCDFRLRKTDNMRIARAAGATVVNRLDELQETDVGTGAGLFEVKLIGDEWVYNCDILSFFIAALAVP